MNQFEAHVKEAGYGLLTIIEDFAVRVNGGEVLAILGSNGAGKSTALRSIMGTIRSRDRHLLLEGRDLSRLPPWALPHQGIVFVPDGARCFPNLTVLENLQGAFQTTRTKASAEELAQTLADVYRLFPVLKDRSAQMAGTLSGGERQMLSIGRALMTAPRVMILDEPSAGLSPKMVEVLFDSLARIKQEQSCAMIVAEQNVRVALRIADQCAVLEHGQVVLSGPMQEVARDERLRTAYLGV
jgi:branched-chain amino acid transport system ATP-binding protein